MRPDVLVMDAGDVLGAARRLREHSRDELHDIPPDFLRRAAQLLRAGVYQATEAARRMDAVARVIEAERAAASRREVIVGDRTGR